MKKINTVWFLYLLIAGVAPLTPASALSTCADTIQTVCKDTYTYHSKVATIDPYRTYVVESPNDCPKQNTLEPKTRELAILNFIHKVPQINVAQNIPNQSLPKQSPTADKAIDSHLTVNFDFDEYSLTGKSVTKLDKFATTTSKDLPISITGYTCWIGSPTHNQILSVKRAESVSHYLKLKGLKINLVGGKGSTEFIDCHNPSPNRRVDVEPYMKGGE